MNSEEGDREGLVAQAAESLRRAILHGVFRPGAKLTLREIARELGTSVTPIREAVAKLVTDGALEARPGFSARVPILDPGRYQELCQIRIVVEGFAAQTAATRIQRNEIVELGAVLRKLKIAKANGAWQEYLRLNKHFRFLVYDKAQMPLLIDIIERLWLRAAPYFALLYPPRSGDAALELVYEELITALTEKDSTRAGDAIRKAIEQGSLDDSSYEMIARKPMRRPSNATERR